MKTEHHRILYVIKTLLKVHKINTLRKNDEVFNELWPVMTFRFNEIIKRSIYLCSSFCRQRKHKAKAEVSKCQGQHQGQNIFS